jgi:hypothetical protein
MTGKDCLCMIFNEDSRNPDYHPVSLKQAKQQLKKACYGKKSTGALIGLHFRLTYLNEKEREEFQTYANNICIDKIKKWNKK